jgi:hypothetical protein
MSEVLNFIIDVTSKWTERNGSPPEELVMHPGVFSALRNFHLELQGAYPDVPISYGYPSRISQVGGMEVKVDPNLAEDEIIFRSGLVTQRMYVNKKKSVDRFKKKRMIRIEENTKL